MKKAFATVALLGFMTAVMAQTANTDNKKTEVKECKKGEKACCKKTGKSCEKKAESGTKN